MTAVAIWIRGCEISNKRRQVKNEACRATDKGYIGIDSLAKLHRAIASSVHLYSVHTNNGGLNTGQISDFYFMQEGQQQEVIDKTALRF